MPFQDAMSFIEEQGQRNINAMQQGQQMQAQQATLADLMRKQQQEAQLRDLLPKVMQSGDPQATLKGLLATGNPQAIALAGQIAPIFAGMQKQDRRKLETIYDETGRPKQVWLEPGQTAQEGTFAGYGKPEKTENWSEPYSMGGATVQRNLATGEVRTAVSRPPVTNVNVGTPKETFKNERDLRNDFQGLPTTKAFREVQTSFDQINYALKNPSAASDLTAATKFMKLLDPGSVVRESELGMAMAATGKLDQMSNYYNMLKTGQKLTPAQRKDFLATAKGLYDAAAGRYNDSVSEYQNLAKEYGLNPERIAKSVKLEGQTQVPPTANRLPDPRTLPSGATVTDNVTGKKMRVVNGQYQQVR